MSRFLKDCYQPLEAYTPGEQPRDMVYIKLNTNESPYPPAPSVVEKLSRVDIENLRLYSDPTCKVLKEKLAGLYGLQPENIFICNGSDDILNFLFMAFPGAKGVSFPDISYGFYSVYAELHGEEARKVPLKEDFSLDYADYLRNDSLVVIANPNAPTGMTISVAQIEQILKANPDNVVVIDEAYIDFGGESCYKLIDRYENLVVVRTFSKSRSMAGGRLGFAMGPAPLIADLEKLKYSTNPYSINRLTLTLGEATVDADAYYVDMCARIAETRTWTAEQLEAIGFTVLPSKANFIFAKAPTLAGGELYRQLKARGILVRHFTAPRIRDYIRITIGTKEQMEAFLNTTKTILQEVAL